MKASATYELVSEHQSSHGPTVVQIRGSLIASSLQTLRDLDLFDRYLECLPTDRHQEVLYVLAASWVPVDVALVHYGACDAMALSEADLDRIGQNASQRILSTFLGTLVRSVRAVTVPTGVPLRQYPRLWERLMLGGSCRVSMCGEKDARIESNGVPMFRYRYFRTAYAGLLRGAILVFRSSAHVRVRSATQDSLTVDLSWV